MITSINNFNVPNGLIEAYDQIKKLNDQHTYVLGVSGGKDSMLLWHLFLKAKKRIVIAHVNYGMREESLEETKLVRQTAARFKTPCHICMVGSRPSSNTQSWAREIRYHFFNQVMVRCAAHDIVTAHHQDDDFENFFIQALRGTSIKGLTSMSRKDNAVLRPLINTPRTVIDDFIQISGIAYKEDSSNTEAHYFRNYLRNEILPKVFSRNEQGTSGLSTTLNNLISSEAFIADLERSWKENCVIEQSFGYLISLQQESLPYLINRFLVSLKIPSAMVETVEDKLKSDSNFYIESQDWIVERITSRLILLQRSFKINEGVFHDVREWQSHPSFDVQRVENFELPSESSVAVLDLEKIRFPISLSPWKEGMRMKPLGMGGKSRLISDVFIDLKVPRSLRSTVPLLVDRDGEVIWLCGIRTSEHIKVTDDTEAMLQVRFLENTLELP